MVEFLDLQPRYSKFDTWELWDLTYHMHAKDRNIMYDRPIEWVFATVERCMELCSDRYQCGFIPFYDDRSNEVSFARIKDKYNTGYDCFGFDKNTYFSYKRAEESHLYFSTGGRTGTLAGKMTPKVIDRLEEDEIFVFGSNSEGRHDGGTARLAMEKFGAEYGESQGLKGQSYAICTTEGLVRMACQINAFIDYAAATPDKRFYVTPIGCGHAGHNPLEVAPLFRKAVILPNVFLPRIFWEYYWQTEDYSPDYFMPDKEWEKWVK